MSTTELPAQHRCPRCQAPVQVGQAVCNVCQLPLDAASIAAFQAYQQRQAAPAPAPYQPLPPRRSTAGRTAGILGVTALLLVVGCVAVFALTDGTKSAAPVATGPTATAAPAPALAEIAAKKAASTDAQWDAYADTLAGKRIDGWPGTISNVDNKAFSKTDFTVRIDTADPEPGYSFDVEVDTDSKTAASFNKGQEVTVSGIIDKVDCLLTYCPIKLRAGTWRVQ